MFQHSEQMVEELEKYNKEYEYVLVEGEGHALTNEKKIIELMTRLKLFYRNICPVSTKLSINLSENMNVELFS